MTDTSTRYIDFACDPAGELIYDYRAPIPLTGDEYLDAGFYFPHAEERGLCIRPPRRVSGRCIQRALPEPRG